MSSEMGWPGVAHKTRHQILQIFSKQCLPGSSPAKLKEGFWASMGLLGLTVESRVSNNLEGRAGPR